MAQAFLERAWASTVQSAKTLIGEDMFRVIVAVAALALGACSEGQTAVEAQSDEGQIGASSGPNANFDGAAAGEAFGEPTTTARDNGDTGAAGDGAAREQPQ